MPELTLLEIKNRLLSFSPYQKGHYNNNCGAKLHSIVQGRLSVPATDFVEITITAIEGLNATDKATLEASLPDSDKLSGWPC